MALVGFIIVCLVFLMAILAPVIAPCDPAAISPLDKLKGPGYVSSKGITHWLGTDEFGRDLLSRLIYGAQISVVVAIGSTVVGGLIGILLGLMDYVGLPADVVYLLVCHCAQRVERRFGPGRRPAMRQIEREGYAWARMGIDSQRSAAAYLRKYAQQQETIPAYMRALGLGERMPSPSEEKYLTAWQEMGFSPEAVALAYDKTVLKCHELKWPYCNGILKKWHQAGLHTVEEIQAGDRPERRQPAGEKRDASQGMRKYMQDLHRDRR